LNRFENEKDYFDQYFPKDLEFDSSGDMEANLDYGNFEPIIEFPPEIGDRILLKSTKKSKILPILLSLHILDMIINENFEYFFRIFVFFRNIHLYILDF